MLSPSYNYSFIFVFSLLILSKLQNYPNVITVCFYITYISIYNLREDTNLNTIKQKITQIIENLISLRLSLRVSLSTSLSPYVSLTLRLSLRAWIFLRTSICIFNQKFCVSNVIYSACFAKKNLRCLCGLCTLWKNFVSM